MYGGQICGVWPQLLVVLRSVPGVQCGLCTLGVGQAETWLPEHPGYQSTWIGILGFFVVHFF